MEAGSAAPRTWGLERTWLEAKIAAGGAERKIPQIAYLCALTLGMAVSRPRLLCGSMSLAFSAYPRKGGRGVVCRSWEERRSGLLGSGFDSAHNLFVGHNH